MPRTKNPLAKLSLEELDFLASRNAQNPLALRKIYAHVAGKKPSKSEQLKRKLEALLRIKEQMFTREQVEILVERALQEGNHAGKNSASGVQSVIFYCQGCGSKLRIPLNRGLGMLACPVCSETYKLQQSGQDFAILALNGARSKKQTKREESSESRRVESNAPMRRSQAYKVLGLEPSASAQEIVTARKRLLQQLHPDKFSSSPERVRALVEEEFKKVEAAFNCLHPA